MNTLSKAARLTLLSAAIILLALTGVPKSNAQATDSNIVGTVTDATGAAIPAAKVTATNTATNVKYDTVSNGEGEYRLNNVPIGNYTITASKAGFTTGSKSGVQLDLNRTATVNVALAVGTVETSVDVTESAALIDTSSSQLQTIFDTSAAADLPAAGSSKIINGAGIYNISLGAAGVAMAGGIGYGTGPSVAGQRSENNTFSIDGVNNDDHDVTGPLVYVSNEAVGQFSVLQNQFSPEFGGAAGGVFNVILKSGTNQIHGSIYEYMQNRDLNAVDNTLVLNGNRSNTRYDNNRLGATIGGAIIKDKLFYFGNFEYNPLGQASTPSSPVTAPTAAGIAILNGMAGLNKTNLGIFTKYVPVATTVDPTAKIAVNGTNIPSGTLAFASPNFSNSYHWIAGIDYNLGNKDQLRGRYIYDKNSSIDTNASLPVFYATEPTLNQMITLSEFHNFSPTLENELRLAYSRHNQQVPVGDFTFPGLSAFPNLSFDELQLQVGPDPNAPSGGIQNLSTGQENITKSFGRHTIKAGYNFTDIILSSFFVQRSRGDYDYATLQQYLLDQQPSGGSLSGVPGERTFGAGSGVPEGFLQHSAYVNDDFRVRPGLTLNLGLRYEYVTVPVAARAQQFSAIANVPGGITFGNPKVSKNDWSPRFGFAYSPGKDQKWVVRGGLGRSFDLPYANLSVNANPAFYQVTQDVNSTNPVSNFLTNGGLTSATTANPTTASARQALSAYTWDQNRPYAINGTLGVQRLLGKDYTVEARYVYTKGVHLYVQDRLNIVPQVTPNNFIPTFFSQPTPTQLGTLTKTLGTTTTPGTVKGTIPAGATTALPYNEFATLGFGQAIVGFNPVGDSRYNGLALQMNKRYSKNFSYQVAYTWSHAQDDSTATLFSTYFTPRRGQDFQNKAADWGDSALDHRHRLTINPTYDLKLFENKGWIMKNVVGNWRFLGGYTYQTGEWATIQSNVDSNLNNDNAGDRTIVNPAGLANVGSDVFPINSAGAQIPSTVKNSAGTTIPNPAIAAYVAKNSNAGYVVAGLGALANAGRNTYRMPATNNFDFSVIKKFNFTERVHLELSGQFANLFNHPQFVGAWINDVSPNPNLGSALGRNELVPSNSKFLQFDQFFTSNSRTIQVVGRIVF
jgi:hypothetical protein